MNATVRVLVVDDDPELRMFLRQELEVEGYDCDTAANGTQALTRIRNERWDLVLLDWTLPDFSGVEVCRGMRTTQDGTPVLMLTARDDVKERVEALDSGADDYLTKPFSIEELLARVRARLRRSTTDPQDQSKPTTLQLADLDVASHQVDAPMHCQAFCACSRLQDVAGQAPPSGWRSLPRAVHQPVGA